MVDTGALRTPGFWLRVVQLIFGIIAFAPIADASGWDRADYAIFCGVVTMIFSLVFIACAIMGITQVRGIPSLIYDTLFVIFWLACAAALSNSLSAWGGWMYGSSKSRLQAACAFSWLTWFAFIGSLVFDVLDLKNGVGIGASRGAAPAGAAPGVEQGKEGVPPGAVAAVV